MAHTVNRTFVHVGCIVGSVHQGSQIFNRPGRGLQCVPNALYFVEKYAKVPQHMDDIRH